MFVSRILIKKNLKDRKKHQKQDILPKNIPIERKKLPKQDSKLKILLEKQIKEKEEKITNEIMMGNEQEEELEQKQEKIQVIGERLPKSKIILQERKNQLNVKKRDLSQSKSPEAVKRQKLMIPTQSPQIMNVLAELRKKIPKFISLG